MSLRQAQRDVRAFHKATGGTIGKTISLRDGWLRANLIAEEATETIAALGFESDFRVERLWPDGQPMTMHYFRGPRESTTGTIDGLCDLIYVALGTAVAMGVDLGPFWNEVQRANMEKAEGPKREDGKQLKPEGWRPPDIDGILQTMLWAELDDLPPASRLAQEAWS